MRIILLLIVVALTFHAAAFAQSTIVISPGVKLGYTFGDKGGFTFGGELSVVTLPNQGGYFVGGVLDFDYCYNAKITKMHLGVEGGAAVLGIDIGPTWVGRNGERDFGLTITPFAGFILFPYYSGTIMAHGDNLNELGVYGKLPLLIEDHLNWFRE